MFDPSEMAAIVRTYLANPEAVLAWVTLVAKTGSSYRQPGARVLVLTDGSTVGTISGGCLEGELALLARKMDEEGRATAVEVIDTRPIFGCQGTITLFVELVTHRRERYHEIMVALNRAFEQRRHVGLVTQWCSPEAGLLGTNLALHDGNDSPTQASADAGEALVQPFGLRKRVILVGGHRDVESVIELARGLHWQCVQIIPGAQRTGWVAVEDRDTVVMELDAAGLTRKIPRDPATAVVVMTHHLGRDISFVVEALRGNYGYVGMLGSSQRREALINHLMELGDEALIMNTEQLHCPIGLNIGSETQQEIALSIISEIQAVFAQRDGTMLKNLSIPIHSSQGGAEG